ncbi:MAG: RecX family transcriptional regulator [Proteobacteria bacterium]|nr:MAG: RecX family transcriptional regulator [Pseudomonadota bacterium]
MRRSEASVPEAASGEAGPPDAAGLAERSARAGALRLLARREHSADELRRKLLAKGHPAQAVDRALDHLREKRLLSDERFVAAFVQQHAGRGQGPVRIRAALRTRGVADETVERALQTAGVDWEALARGVRQRKFGAVPAQGLTERAKQARFLQYRGFSAEQIRAALAGGAIEDGDIEWD